MKRKRKSKGKGLEYKRPKQDFERWKKIHRINVSNQINIALIKNLSCNMSLCLSNMGTLRIQVVSIDYEYAMILKNYLRFKSKIFVITFSNILSMI